ncbi:hypothetical protein QVN42_18650 [Yersinia nurmii]|uniref:Alpha-related fimbriae major subunit n=1 Tax=Yersinia nurmii TaxID=685706 RepID=A0AAW7K8G5_9GAMM|nr:hypothetical protein [Yersinia nurmii]MDN0089369.1 hypothetical protein [Yersinia nurmii]CNF03363.1 alpha-related fimbriae major subunit [Yersinia nurmii]
MMKKTADYRNFCAFVGALVFTSTEALAQITTAVTPLSHNYTNCRMALGLNDRFIKISFNAFVHDIKLKQILRDRFNLSENIPIPDQPEATVLNLFFFDEEGHKDLVQYNISASSLNGEQPTRFEDHNKLVFTHDVPFQQQMKITLRTPTKDLKYLAVNATLGYQYSVGDKIYRLIDENAVTFGRDGNTCDTVNIQTVQAPAALYVDPQFKLSSAVWQLKPIDLYRLNSYKKNGLTAQMIYPRRSMLCLNYTPLGLDNPSYTITATGKNPTQSDSHFSLMKDSDMQIHYAVELVDNTGSSFALPGSYTINLKQQAPMGNGWRKKICWLPRISLFPTDSTEQGLYSDTLSFTITPHS